MQLWRGLDSSERYYKEAVKLLNTYRERRDRANRRFAETLAAGYEKALHTEGVSPLHRVWKRQVADGVWQSEPEAQVYLVVLDGCSYPVFLELLFALAQDPAFPVGIAADADGHVSGLPALAPLPTVTSHSRGALFLGELPNDPLVSETLFRDREEAKTDKARFRQNGFLGQRSRKLFLKGDLSDRGQALCQELRDTPTDVVAAVFNAVDDKVESSETGEALRIDPESIRGFKPSLRAALEKRRRKVLITADHGFTPYVANGDLRAGAGSRRRFLSLEEGASVPEGFLEIDLAGLGGPPERRAFAWRSGVYLGHPKVGFHGGCGLEEMVVPLAWLERDGLHADEPSWWFGRRALPEPPAPPRDFGSLETPLPPDPVPAPGSDRPDKSGPTEASPQLSLFDAPPELSLPEAALARLSPDQKRVLEILRENGSARAGDLARLLKKNPLRLNGLIVQMCRVLHAEDFVLVTSETLPNGEAQYKYQEPPA